eukprot:gene26133-biopygen14250
MNTCDVSVSRGAAHFFLASDSDVHFGCEMLQRATVPDQFSTSHIQNGIHSSTQPESAWTEQSYRDAA